jgi:hypothetical protein
VNVKMILHKFNVFCALMSGEKCLVVETDKMVQNVYYEDNSRFPKVESKMTPFPQS